MRLLLLLVTFLADAHGLFNVYPRYRQHAIRGDPGVPLFLTPLLEAGKIQEAQAAARVLPLAGDSHVTSYSGYLTVDKSLNSNMFFWFFPAEVGYALAPVVLWLQGGPGATSLFGLFTENGPFYVGTDYTLHRRKYSWSKTHSVIFIDNPVGTGYSFTDKDEGYARNEVDVGRNLHIALMQFFTLFPDLQPNPFFVTGESYGGKYVPAVSYAIHTNNPSAAVKINLQGLAIGNGLSDPENMLKYGDYLYQHGLIDITARTYFQAQEALGVHYIRQKKFDKAFEVFDSLLNGDMTQHGSTFFNLTGFSFYFNYLQDHEVNTDGDMGKYVQMAAVRRAIHVGNSTWHTDNKVEVFLMADVMDSVRPWIEELLAHYRVLVYNGQLDIIVAYPLTLGYLQVMQFPGAEDYKTAARKQWHVGNELAGFVKQAGNLTELLVRNAGHMVPSDQPKWASDLLNRFTANKPYHREDS